MSSLKLYKVLCAFEYATICSTGVILLLSGYIPGTFKIEVLGGTFFTAAIPFSVRVYTGRWSYQRLFSMEGWKEALPRYGAFTVLGTIALFLYSIIFNTKVPIDYSTLVQYSLGGSIVQEFLYRLYLWNLGKEFFGESYLNDIVNVIVFVAMHSFYPTFWERLWILIPAGVLFTFLYKRYPNILFISTLHIILNAVAVSLGIFR